MNAMGLLVKGITAGFIATCVLSALMLTKGWLPQLDIVTTERRVVGCVGRALGIRTRTAGRRVCASGRMGSRPPPVLPELQSFG